MSNVITEKPRRGSAGMLVLRLAVAGVLAWAGYQRFHSDPAPPGETPIAAAASTNDMAANEAAANNPSVNDEPVAMIDETAGALADEAATTQFSEPMQPPAVPTEIVATDVETVEPRAAIEPNGVKVSFGWSAAVGACEFGMAGLMLLGLFTRLVSLVGIGTIAGAGLAAEGFVNTPNLADPLVQAYAANPLAAILLGAIFLAFLVSGGGPLALRRRARDKTVATTAKLA